MNRRTRIPSALASFSTWPGRGATDPLSWEAINERPKWTRNHGTLLVNGRGQLGEGHTWFDRKAVLRANARSAIVKAEPTAAFDYAVGDGRNIYPGDTGLKRFRRHFIYVRPDFVVVADELQAASPVGGGYRGAKGFARQCLR